MENKKVQVYLFGGLGNQIFQFYFGVYLNKFEKKNVVFNETLTSNFGNSHGARLSKILKIKSTYISSKMMSKLFSLSLRLLIRIRSGMRIAPVLKSLKVYIAPSTGYTYKHDDHSAADRYFGYFQTWRYFESVGGKSIFHEMLSGPRSEQFTKYSGLLRSNKTIGIHIRMGDYLTLSESYGILDKSFYAKALARLGMDESNQVFLVSDDIDFAKEFLSDLAPNLNWIYLRDTEPLDSMLLLGLCEKICISNSTFGYWAAMLGNPGTVVAPKTWFRNLPDPVDLLPSDWLLQPSEWRD